MPVTDKMKDFASKIANGLEIQTPDDMEDYDSVNAFIDENKDAFFAKTNIVVSQCAEGHDIVHFSDKGYKCEECGIVVWKNILGQTISQDDAVKIINGEQINMTDLKGKKGPFDAGLKYDAAEEKVIFVFDS